jgi:hypothetical protein
MLQAAGMSRVIFPIKLLNFPINLILPAALWALGNLVGDKGLLAGVQG